MEKRKRVGIFSGRKSLRKRARSLQAVFSVGLIIPPRVRSRKGVKKRGPGRAAHIKRELNVEISVSPQRVRDDGGGPARHFLSLPFSFFFLDFPASLGA